MTDSIEEAILAVYGEVEYVQKQRSPEGGVPFAYAGEAALIEALRPAMVKHGITVHVSQIHNMESDTYPTSSGKAMNRTRISMSVTFTHAPSKTSVTVMSAGEGADMGDKSTPKAMTGGFKYALRQTFCIETGTDPDDSTPEPRQSAPRPQSAPPPAPPEEKARGGFFATVRELGFDLNAPGKLKELHGFLGLTCDGEQHDTRTGEGYCHALGNQAKAHKGGEAKGWIELKDKMKIKAQEFASA